MCRPYTSLSRPIFLWFKHTYRQPNYLTDMIISNKLKKNKKNLFIECENAEMRGKKKTITKK